MERLQIKIKEKVNIQVYKYLMVVVSAIFLGIFIEWLSLADFSVLTLNSNYEKKNFALNDVIIKDYDDEITNLISNSNDPWLELPSIDTYVHRITLNYKKAPEYSYKLQIFFSNQENNYSEEDSIIQYIQGNQKHVSIVIDRQVEGIRLDIGDVENISFNLDSIKINDSNLKGFMFPYNQQSPTRILIYAVVMGVILGFVFCGFDKTMSWLYQNRFIIGFGVILFCTVFKLSGSSIASYSNWLPGYDFKPLLGVSRDIRSDEFNVLTTMTFSQAYDKNGSFQYFGDVFRGTNTDMFIVYGQPIKSILMIFRPFQIGYLFLGLERGLAFFWSARLVILFLVTFEFFMLLTKKNKLLSLGGAFLISFAPLVQWWFSVNGIVELLVFSQLALIIFDKYLVEKKVRKKFLYALIISICAVGYVLVFYPSWQIPVIYITLGCGVWILKKNWKEKLINWKDLFIVIISIIFVLMSLGYIFIKSYDTIMAVLNTSYPGERLITGGRLENISLYFKSYTNLFTPYIESNITSNQPEMAGFYDFFPLGMFFSLFVLIKNKKKDFLLMILMIINVFMILFTLFEWPSSLAQITLLSKCEPARLMLGISVINIILLFRAFTIVEENKAIHVFRGITIIMIFPIICLAIRSGGSYITFSMKLIIAGIIIIMTLLIVFIDKKKNMNIFISICIIISILSGASVNPIQQGNKDLYTNILIRSIKEINDHEPGKWVVTDSAFINNNMPTLVGASTINSTNTYPNIELWKKLNLPDDAEEIYNRYAHFNILINDNAEPMLDLIQTDLIQLTCDISTLKQMGAKYILTRKELSNEVQENGITQLFSYENYYIYVIN